MWKVTTFILFLLWLTVYTSSLNSNPALGSSFDETPFRITTYPVSFISDSVGDKASSSQTTEYPKNSPQKSDCIIDTESTTEVEEMLTWFASQLKTFIHETHFDTFRFDAMIDRLSNDFVDIFSLTKTTVFKNKTLVRQLTFIDCFFDTMICAADSLLRYNNVSSIENYLLNRLLDLHIRLFNLFDSRGLPDYHQDNFEQKVTAKWEQFKLFDQAFADLTLVPEEKYYVYQWHRGRIEDILKLLLSWF